MLVFACMLLLLVCGVNSIACAPGYTCYQESPTRVWVIKNDGNLGGPSCASVCSTALCPSGAYHTCDTARTVVSGANFNAIAAGLGFTCQAADCWPNSGSQMMYVALGNASARTCYFPANASGTYDCNGNPGNANCWGERFSLVCPCAPSTLEQSCPWQAPPANTAVAKWGATSTRDGSCLNRINYWRQRACAEGWPECPPCGLPPMVECVSCHECANSQADYDVVHGAHAAFTRCGDMIQGEAQGFDNCADVIDAFVGERAVFPDSNGKVVCRGHCGPIVMAGCQSFFWGVEPVSGYYTLNWGNCPTQGCNAYCNNPAQTQVGGACRTDAWSYNASASVTVTPLPTFAPTRTPTALPTRVPTFLPTPLPTRTPTSLPTSFPTTSFPTLLPSLLPTRLPTSLPTFFPTQATTFFPTSLPTFFPTSFPTRAPTSLPTPLPTFTPAPTSLPISFSPTRIPTFFPTRTPTALPTYLPTSLPTFLPTRTPTSLPTSFPTLLPTRTPTPFRTSVLTSIPTSAFTSVPLTPAITPQLNPFPSTHSPTRTLTQKPTRTPTQKPTQRPTRVPTQKPTRTPTRIPTRKPTRTPTQKPTHTPTRIPTQKLTRTPSRVPSNRP